MTQTVIQAPAPAHLPVQGSTQVFPVRRVYCVGRNYADHAIEMGHDPDREPPFFFLKPADCLIPPGADFPYPVASNNVHFELEQVVALGQGGADIPVEQALGHVWGYGAALDMTRRDLQAEAKSLRRPWAPGKAFDASAPVSALVSAADVGHPASGAVRLRVNGDIRQDGDLNQMIWKVPEIISTLSRLFRLHPGDLILTGTPAGVGPVQRGDHLQGEIGGIATLDVKVV